MRLSHFFIVRPIFAIVVSLVIMIIGTIAYFGAARRAVPRDRATHNHRQRHLSRRQRPDRRRYRRRRARAGDQRRRGHDLHVLAVDQRRHRVDQRHVRARHRHRQALRCWCKTASARREPRLPDEVAPQRASPFASDSPDLLLVVHLISPDRTYDQVYISNYALLNVSDELARVLGRGRRRAVRLARILHARVARPRAHRRCAA